MKKTIRSVGWLATAALVGAALISPASALAEGNPPDVECAGYDYYFKIDNIGDSGISAGSYTGATPSVESNWTGQTITISNVTASGQAFDWASTLTVSKVVAKEGSSEFSWTDGLPGKAGSVTSMAAQGLSHVTFCGDAEPTPTPTPTPVVTPTPEPEVTPTPTPVVTPTPEPEVTPTPEPEVTPTPEPEVTPTPEPEVTPTPEAEVTPTPQATPTGTVEAATGKPQVTPPSTDTVSGGSSSTGNGLGVVLLALGGLALAASLLRPAGKRVRR